MINDEKIKNEVSDSIATDVLYDENGRPYITSFKTRTVPRRTFIKAHLIGKYRGEIDKKFSCQFQQSQFFEFDLYEVFLNNAEYSKFPLPITPSSKIPRDRLPKLLPIILDDNGCEYEIDLHDPILSKIYINRKLHQRDGDLVFGTLEALVTGYLVDFVQESFSERQYIDLTNSESVKSQSSTPTLSKTKIATGNVEYKEGYKRVEYFYDDMRSTYWSDWVYVRRTNTSMSNGCSSIFFTAFGLFVGFIFLILIVPQAAFFLPFLFIHITLRLISRKGFEYFARGLLFLVILGFLFSLIYFFNGSTKKIVPSSEVVETHQESKVEVVLDNRNDTNGVFSDTLIKHFRVWSDYSGNIYKGSIWTRKKDFHQARFFKTSLLLDDNSVKGYDKMLFLLKENDKNNLGGVYQLFDSLRFSANFTEVGFAELIVSFIQDIPYYIVLPLDCDPKLYNDSFVKDYLSNANARCDGFEKFGINGPIEFMSSLYGDCDTRTLLLYTILSHYNYDVVLLSSEYYGHSLLGINLPLTGLSYKDANKRYVLWETTAPNLRAGVIAKEICDLNYWRISLKSN